MIDDVYPDPAEREVLREEDELLAFLVGEYIARRDVGAIVLLDELLAQAAEFGDATKDKLEDLIVLYETHRASDR